MNPAKRATAQECLEHPWLSDKKDNRSKFPSGNKRNVINSSRSISDVDEDLYNYDDSTDGKEMSDNDKCNYFDSKHNL